MKTRTVKKVKINKEQFYKELKRRGITGAEASREMGFSDNYLASAVCLGELPERSIKLLEALFGIKPESYIVTEEVKEEVKEEAPESVFDIDHVVEELKAINGSALITRDAMTDVIDALNDIRDELRRMNKSLGV